MFTVYIIENEKKKRYTGHTDNIDDRLNRHNGLLKSKTTSYTKRIGGHWSIVYSEEFNTRKEAFKREKFLKSGIGRKFLKEHLGP